MVAAGMAVLLLAALLPFVVLIPGTRSRRVAAASLLVVLIPTGAGILETAPGTAPITGR